MVLLQNEQSSKSTETIKDKPKIKVCEKSEVSCLEVPELTKTKTEPTRSEMSEIDESNVNFSQSRELWQRRSNSESTSVPLLLKSHRLSEPYLQRQNHTPDLVMDLPLVGNSSPKELVTKPLAEFVETHTDSSPDEEAAISKSVDCSNAESPEMQTAAETFAKQSQSTLKKNKKVHLSENADYLTITSPVPDRKYATLGGNSPAKTTTFKPQFASKPIVLKKPVFPAPLRSVSIETMSCKDPPDLPT